MVNTSVAIISTRIPVLFNEGFWKMAHEARTDFSMLIASIFLVIVGADKMSIDSLTLKSKMKIHDE